jgi:hypothetical protein
MNNMSSNSRGEQNPYIEINGAYFVHDPESNLLKPVQVPVENYDEYVGSEDDYAEVQSEMPKQRQEKRRKYGLSAKLWMGGLAVGAIVLPPVAHVAAEQVASQAINFFDPRPDKGISQNELFEDISVSINRIVGGQNG